MNVWHTTRRESSGAHRKGSWLGALARSLRNWWGKFLLGDAHPAAGQSQEEAPASPPISVAEHEGTAAVATLEEPFDPVVDWLARVREGAPGLLLSPEEGGTPWVRAAEAGSETLETIEDVEDAGDWLRELAPELTNLRSQKRERIRREINKATHHKDKGTKWSWSRLFKGKSDARTEPVGPASVEIPRGNAGEESSSQAAPLGFRPLRNATSRNLTEGRQTSFSETRTGEAPVRDGMEGSHGDLHKPLHAGRMLPSFEGRRNKTEEVKPKEAELNSAGATNAFKETTSSDRASSNLLVNHPTFPSLAGEAIRPASRFGARRSEAGAAPAQKTRNAARRISPNVLWPTIPRRENTQQTFDKRLLFTDELPGSKQTYGLDELPKSEPDRWADLPEDLASGDLDWTESLRDSEHIHALEIEQQGGN